MKRVKITLKSQMTFLMTILVILQSVALIFSIIISGTFIMLDSEAFRVMNSTTLRRTQICNDRIKNIVKVVSEEAEFLNEKINKITENMQVGYNQICNNDKVYEKVSASAGDSLVFLLNRTKVTGAFIVFSKSNARKDDVTAHSCIYIRDEAPDLGAGNIANYSLEMGPVSVVEKYKISSSMNWTLDWKFDKGSDNYNFYNKPIQASKCEPISKIERYGYWNKPLDILNDGVNVVTYTVPLLDDDGNVYAIMGIEHNVSNLEREFLQISELPYENGFYLISDFKNNKMSLDWYMSSKIILKEYLSESGILAFGKVKKTKLYKTDTEKMGVMFCSSYKLKMYGKNSIFADEYWSLTSFVPEWQLRESSVGVRNTLIVSIAATTVLSFLAIIFIAQVSTRKLSGLSDYIRNLKPYQDINFFRTGTREIDDLMTAVEVFNKNIINASQTVSHILDLTSLPMGAFKINSDGSHIIITEFIKKLFSIGGKDDISKNEWEKYYKTLTSNVYDNKNYIYEYYYEKEKRFIFLKIIEGTTENDKIGVIIDVTKDIEDKKKLAYQVDHDALTHLYNRKAFKREVENKIKNSPQCIGAMIFADLDNLKYTNDMYGHEAGDMLIKNAAELFRSFSNVGGITARISGDEFAIYIHGYNSKQELLRVIQEYMAKRDNYNFKTSTDVIVKVRASVGIAWYPADSENVGDLLKMSDFAMYEVKRSEKGGIREFDTSSYKKTAYLSMNSESLNRLIDEELIKFAYQPIIDLKTGEVYGYEMLMRSMMNEFKSPNEILSVAENQGKLGGLERLVIFKALESIRKNLAVLKNVKLFINTIPNQVISEEDFGLLEKEYSDLFSKIVIEIIETENDSPEKFDSKIKFIREHNIMLAIDDFGSGYSNELRILSLQPDIIKIDMGIVQGVHNDTDKQAIIWNLVSFCESKNTKIIAEGVETKEDLKTVYDMGVDFVQGYYTGKPNLEILDIKEEVRNEILNL